MYKRQATSEYVKEIKSLPVKRQVSVSGILKKLGVSRSGYNAWKKRVPSDTSVRRAVLKEKIQKIYEESHQNYGAPKITAELRKSGEYVSEKTVGNYMRQMGIKAHWVKPYVQTTIDSDFSQKLKNILNEEFNPAHPDAVWCSDTVSYTHLDVYKRQRLSWSAEEVDAKLKGIMVNICHNMADAAEKYGFKGNYVVGANIAGFEKVVDAMTAQGIV